MIRTVLSRTFGVAVLVASLWSAGTATASAAQADPASRWLMNGTGSGTCLDVAPDQAGGLAGVVATCDANSLAQRWILRPISNSASIMIVHEQTGQRLGLHHNPSDGAQPFLRGAPVAGRTRPAS